MCESSSPAAVGLIGSLCNPSTLGSRGNASLGYKFQTNLGYRVRSCLSKGRKEILGGGWGEHRKKEKQASKVKTSMMFLELRSSQGNCSFRLRLQLLRLRELPDPALSNPVEIGSEPKKFQATEGLRDKGSACVENGLPDMRSSKWHWGPRRKTRKGGCVKEG